MNAERIVEQARKLGVRLAVFDGIIKASPPNTLPDDLKAAIREHAPEVKAILATRRSRPGDPDPELAAAVAAVERAFPGARLVEVRHGERPTEPCRWCRGRKFWRKSCGPWVCERCHPPVENPSERCTVPDIEGAELSQSGIVEARFRPTVELVYPQPGPTIRPTNPEFPRCPECDVARYWIAPTGKVICGSCGKVRLVITAIEYHSVQ
jgi:ribosomal protein L37AE/L43A